VNNNKKLSKKAIKAPDSVAARGKKQADTVLSVKTNSFNYC
jgi:hypothetical protein